MFALEWSTKFLIKASCSTLKPLVFDTLRYRYVQPPWRHSNPRKFCGANLLLRSSNLLHFCDHTKKMFWQVARDWQNRARRNLSWGVSLSIDYLAYIRLKHKRSEIMLGHLCDKRETSRVQPHSSSYLHIPSKNIAKPLYESCLIHWLIHLARASFMISLSSCIASPSPSR